MKKLFSKKYTLFTCVIITTLIICSIYIKSICKADNVSASENTSTDYASIKRDTHIQVDSNGTLKINRSNKSLNNNSSFQDPWALYIYMTGSDLETNYQSASNDILEIINAYCLANNVNNVNNLQVYIQTGGSHKWSLPDINNKQVQRFTINALTGKLKLIESLGQQNMGEANTLYNFLNWGVSNYPAQKMGVILWNHGSGITSGICNDENFNDDSLSVHELEYCFAKVSKEMSSKFEIICFDTCLAGSLEYANLLAPYSNYMLASADIIPGEGYNYTSLVNYLFHNPNSNGYELGRTICDSYKEFYDSTYINKPINYTLALYDLNKVDNACIEMNYLCKYIYDNLPNSLEEYKSFQELYKCNLKYSDDNIDIGAIFNYIEREPDFNYNTYYTKQAIKDLVVYSSITNKYIDEGALGITLYLPYNTLSLHNLNNYRNVAFSPYWLNYVEWRNIRKMTSIKQKISSYNHIDWDKSPYFFEDTFNFLNYDVKNDFSVNNNNIVYLTLSTNDDYVNDGFLDIWKKNIEKVIPTASNPFIPGLGPKPILKPNIDVTIKNNLFTTKLKSEDFNNLSSIYNTVFTTINDKLVCLGQDNKIIYNKENNSISSDFNGQWFALPDGQLLTAYIISNNDEKTIYSFPLYINDKECSIRVQETTDNNGISSYVTLGIWDGNDNKYKFDEFVRGYIPIENGMRITPIYDVYNIQNNTYETIYGEEYTIAENFKFIFSQLENKNYSFAFEFEDINSVSYYSELYN